MAATPLPDEPRRLRRLAKRRLREGRPGRAGELFLLAGDRPQALKTFLEAGLSARAAPLLEEEGSDAAALELYMGAGDDAGVARVAERLGRHELAADHMERCGRWWDAARIWERRGKPLRAARAYRHGGALGKAAIVLIKVGDQRGAADLFYEGKEFERAGHLYLDLGDLAKAAHAFVAGRCWADAARCYERLGRPRDALKLGVQAALAGGDLARAADGLERLGERAAAAERWLDAGRPDKAAPLLEALGQAKEAADRYAEAGDTVAELRVRTDVGEDVQDWLRLASLRLEAGDMTGAEEAGKRIDEDDPRWRDACGLLGDVYRLWGRPGAAMVKYRQAVSGLLPEPSSAETFYLLAVCAQAAGELETALAALELLREHDPAYEDVEPRYVEVRDKLEARRASHSDAANRYERRGRLGEGGIGVVWRAYDQLLQREVALKVLHDARADAEEARDLFLREARSAARLNHPNIVMVHDFGALAGELFLAMELVDGISLRDLVRTTGHTSSSWLADVAHQAAVALAYAHAHGVIHRDIKPANLLWTHDSRLKVTDFGLAKTVVIDVGRTVTPAPRSLSGVVRLPGRLPDVSQSRVAGTPRYMSPEQFSRKRVDPRTDLYSLGVSLYELAVGAPPFMSPALPLKHRSAPRPVPSAARPDLPEWVDRVVLRCMAIRPDDRYDSAGELLADLPA